MIFLEKPKYFTFIITNLFLLNKVHVHVQLYMYMEQMCESNKKTV